jgi:DNA-binding transcriptional ArsR family regulator
MKYYPSTAKEIARLCRALSVENRVRIIGLLQDGPLCVGALSARLGITQGAVSQHLRVLREAGLVRPRKISYFTHYDLERKALGELAGKIEPYSRITKRKGETPCAAARPNAKNRRT